MTKYLIIGTGGVGGSIAAFLGLAGEDVTCIARGEHLKAIQEKGIHLKSGLKGEHFVKVKATTAEEYNDTADVIIVCVKQYSLESIKTVITKASHNTTLVLPILNIFNTGGKLSTLVPEATILDGCIYIVGFVSGIGEITQMGKVFRLIFGAREVEPVDSERLSIIAQSLRNAGIKVEVSDNIARDTFTKWSFISAMACTGAYFDCDMGALQNEGEQRDLFIGLSRESGMIGLQLGIKTHDSVDDLIAANLNVIDHLAPESTASMQKDIARNHESEIQGMLFDMVELGKKLSVDMPTYCKVYQKFESFK